jgi:hypothetical protein
VKLFQIEEPDGSPADPDMPGAAVGIDLTGARAEVATAVGGNAVILADRDGFDLDLTVPPADAPQSAWQELLEGVRLRAERALARPVTHAVVVLPAAEPAFTEKLIGAADAAGLTLLDLLPATAITPGEPAVCAAAVLAEDLAPRPGAA